MVIERDGSKEDSTLLNYQEWKENIINRKEEIVIPKFKSKEEAERYFKQRHGNNFQEEESIMFADQRCYFYALIFDRENYLRGREELSLKGYVDNICDYMFSFQTVEIMEDGDVHIVS